MPLIASNWRSSQLMNRPDYEVNHYCAKDFGTVEMHSHDFYELYFFMSGVANYIIENGHYALRRGDILLIAPNNLHQLDVSKSQESYERVVLWIAPKYLRTLSTNETDLSSCFSFCSSTGNHLIRDTALSAFIRNHLALLMDVTKNEKYGNDVEAKLVLERILLELCRYVKEERTGFQKPERNPTVTKAIAYIDAHLTEDLSLDCLANTLFVDKYYLSHLFKQETNISPHRYIIKKRLLFSKQYIESGLPIREVYLKAGFADYTHFFRAFKQEYGFAPKAYLGIIGNEKEV